jgi:hypothetical protein
MTGERKLAILFAATILAARKLIDMDSKQTEHGEGIPCRRRIDLKWPAAKAAQGTTA